jgi:hypothetical protein
VTLVWWFVPSIFGESVASIFGIVGGIFCPGDGCSIFLNIIRLHNMTSPEEEYFHNSHIPSMSELKIKPVRKVQHCVA